MVTGRYEGAHGIQPASALAALALSAAMVSGLVISSPAVQKRIYKTFTGTSIPLAQPTPEPMPDLTPVVRTKVVPDPRPRPVDTTTPVVRATEAPFAANSIPDANPDTGIDPIAILPPQPMPSPAAVLTTPQMDSRYVHGFQPAYPPAEQRAGREGLVSVRILVGTDGRVKRIERIAAASDAFWTATQRQALAHWRFRPATRDGVAVEGWREMTVRFVMPE